MYTIVSAIVEPKRTSDQTYEEFMEKRAALAKKGWMPYGDVMYYVNGVSQAMTFGTPDMSDLEVVHSLGSTHPRTLKFCYGSEGVFGTYFDVNTLN
jgi:hypothetical protein